MDQKKNKGNNIFSFCNGILLYGDWVVIPAVLTKKILEGFSYQTSKNIKNESSHKDLSIGMDKEIKKLAKTVLAAKAPPVKFNPWPKTDKLWSSLHIDYAGIIKGTYSFIVVDSFTKCPESF